MTRWLYGQAPSRRAGSERAFDGASGRKLAELTGLSHDEFLERFETRNLLNGYPGRSDTGGDLFTLALASEAATKATHDWADGDVVVLAGRHVARAFGVYDLPYFQVAHVWGGVSLVVIPHPSSINRLWNDPETSERAARALAWALGKEQE